MRAGRWCNERRTGTKIKRRALHIRCAARHARFRDQFHRVKAGFSDSGLVIRPLKPQTPNLVWTPRAPFRPYVVTVAVGLALGLVLSAFGVLLPAKNDSTSASAAAIAGGLRSAQDPRSRPDHPFKMEGGWRKKFAHRSFDLSAPYSTAPLKKLMNGQWNSVGQGLYVMTREQLFPASSTSVSLVCWSFYCCLA